jgi:hypothetical protein
MTAMFKLMAAICVITSFDGMPVNSCYLLEDKKIYNDINLCVDDAALREVEIMNKYTENSGNSNIVVQALCFKTSGA